MFHNMTLVHMQSPVVSLLFSTLLLLFNINCSYGQESTSNYSRVEGEGGLVWDVVVKTCDESGAGTDASVYIKVYYEAGLDYQTFNLDSPSRNDFEQGKRDHFKLQLKQSDIVNMGLFWWPGFSLNQSWCVSWVLLLNSDTESCFEGIFDKWILHYRDPPTYASRFHKLSFVDCVSPGLTGASRKSYLRYEDNQAPRNS